MSKLVRVSDMAYSKLDQMAQFTGNSRQEIIDQAINNLERETILKQANDACVRIRSNKKNGKKIKKNCVYGNLPWKMDWKRNNQKPCNQLNPF